MSMMLLTLVLSNLGWTAVAALQERQNCGSAYQQCGGQNFKGATCCASGYTCNTVNDYYSQCLPGDQASQGAGSNRGGPTATASSPTPTSYAEPVMSAPPTAGPGTATWSGNPFSGVSLWANSYYAAEVTSSAIPSLSPDMAAKAAKVAKTPSFMWLDTADKVTLMGQTLDDIRVANANASTPYAGIFVVYDLPDRDCAAAASNGEYSIASDGITHYKAYIDSIVAQVTSHSDILNILVVEPDSLANMVTNMNVAKCSNAKAAYIECVEYAIKQLNLPNVAMYLDAGHAGWLGWAANISPAAKLFAQVWQEAGSPSQVRGLATNVANYNAWTIASPPSYTQGDSNYDEQLYINALAPLLNQAGFPTHFVVDTSRNGVQPTKQQQWGDWCNVIGTGFGVRPTTDTGDALADAFVWVKPGGECDGTSNTSASRYDYHCGMSDALKPSPEAGSWFEAYFEQLLTNANPPF